MADALPPGPICAGTRITGSDCHRVNVLSPAPRTSRADRLLRCQRCEFQWIFPPPEATDLEDAYRDTDGSHWGTAGSVETADARDYAKKVALVTSHVDRGRALDLGCFHGDLLAALPASFEKVGVELSVEAIAIARSRGIAIVPGDLMSVSLQAGGFDAVFCMDTIEHVVDQTQLARRLAEWLAPDGILVIETGDGSAPFARFMGPRWSYVSLLEHVCAHSRESLTRLMASVGLVPLTVERRWHTRPTSEFKALKRLGMAATFRAGTALLDVTARVARLPARVEQWRTRWAPWHPSRDHVLASYVRPTSRHLRDRQ